jgi:hypothetical protein
MDKSGFLINFVEGLKNNSELYTLQYMTEQVNLLFKDVELDDGYQLIYHFEKNFNSKYNYLEDFITHWQDLDQYSGTDIIKITSVASPECYFARQLKSEDGYSYYTPTTDFYPAKQIPVETYYYKEIILNE